MSTWCLRSVRLHFPCAVQGSLATFLQQMEEVVLAAALVLDVLALWGWMLVTCSTKVETTGKIQICGLWVKQDQLSRVLHCGGTEIVSAGGQRGKYHGKELGKDGGGRSLLCLLAD